MTPQPAARPMTVWVALVTVYLVWGSTYLAIRIVVETVPPMLAMGARFLLAAMLLGGFLAIRYGVGVLRVRPREVAAAGLVGALLLLGGNGLVAVGEQTVPSGLAALLLAATPLWLVAMRTADGDRPRPLSLLGTGLGFVGIAVLARPGTHGDVKTWGLLVLILAALCWATGSFFSSRVPLPRNPFVATAYEMAVGGLLLAICGAARGELRGFSVSDVAGEGLAWLTYLVLVGSIIGFTAYVWLLGNASLSLTATYAYVNPVVAVALGALVLSEPITLTIMAGGAIVVAGVCLVVTMERPRRPTPTPPPATAELQRSER